MSSEAALSNLEQAKGARNAEVAALAVKDLLGQPYDLAALAEGLARITAMVDDFRRSDDKAKLAPALMSSGELNNAMQSAAEALKDAEEAVDLFRSLGNSKGLASALEVVFQAHCLQNNPRAGLKAANKEAQAFRQAGDKKGEVAVLETIAHAHGELGEPFSSIKNYEQALALYQALGDKESTGSALHSIAEMRRATGEHTEFVKALDAARQSEAAFKAAKCQWGEEKARATLSSLMAEAGRMQKAPNRQEAVKALQNLVKAVQNKSVSDAKEAEAILNKMRDLITDEEIVENLGPVVKKDPDAIKFLTDLGWRMHDEVATTGEKLDGNYIKSFGQQAFYLFSFYTGMGFGPQFRSVVPWRHGKKAEDAFPMCVAQLPETESWQMELGFRPGVMDASLQMGQVMAWQ